MKAILKKSTAAEPYTFSFVNDEGKMVVRSENYKARGSAVKGLNSVKKNCTEDKRYDLKESANGKYFFNVKSGNHQIIATSAMFDSVEDRSKAIEHVKANAPECVVEEASE